MINKDAIYQNILTATGYSSITDFQSRSSWGLTVDNTVGTTTKLALVDELYNADITNKIDEGAKFSILSNFIRGNGFPVDETVVTLLGIRCKFYADFRQNEYDDYICVLSKDKTMMFKASTDPGVNGAVVVCSNQVIQYEKGLHKGKYPALRPVVGQQFYMQRNGEIFKAWKPTNIHSGGLGFSEDEKVKNWSEGCQVIIGRWGNDWAEFKDYIYDLEQNVFDYVLLDISQF